jgi:hypothetical protein
MKDMKLIRDDDFINKSFVNNFDYFDKNLISVDGEKTYIINDLLNSRQKVGNYILKGQEK